MLGDSVWGADVLGDSVKMLVQGLGVPVLGASVRG